MKMLNRQLFFSVPASVLAYVLAWAPASVSAEAISGYRYITEETRTMQDDDFANPGLLSVDRGEELFNEKHVTAKKQEAKSCAGCHGEQGEKLNVEKIAA
ncbi:MAG: DUF1924 domain-containing protein, partial [Proteobacteria bacterium]|nr:DUF1924 domain-containing protein [Pseudomonadota bacterium]